MAKRYIVRETTECALFNTVDEVLARDPYLKVKAIGRVRGCDHAFRAILWSPGPTYRAVRSQMQRAKGCLIKVAKWCLSTHTA